MRTPKFLNMYAGLPRSIYFLFIARIVNSMGMFVYPFLTLFMTKKMGFTKATAGIFATLGGVAYITGSVIGGKIADHYGRKKIILTFQTMAALTFITCGFLGTTMAVPFLLIAASFFGGLADPANGAMVTDLTSPKNRKAAFSLLYLAINIGVAVGSMVAGYLFENHTRWLFWGDGITSLLALTLVFLFVKETLPDDKAIEERTDIVDTDERAEQGSVFKALLKRPILIGFILINTILGLVYSQHSFSIPIQLEQIFPDTGAALFGSMMAINAVVVLIMTVPLTNATKNIKPILNVSMVGLIYALGFGMLYYSNVFYLFVISTILWTTGEIISVTNIGVFIANHSPITHRGRFNSIFSLISAIGLMGPIIMGIYIDTYGVRMVWPLLFVLGIVGGGLHFTLYTIEKRLEKRKAMIN